MLVFVALPQVWPNAGAVRPTNVKVSGAITPMATHRLRPASGPAFNPW